MGNETETKPMKELVRIDPQGNFECLRCGFTHSVQECAEYRLAMSDRELKKLERFLHAYPEFHAVEGETPIETMIRTYKTVRASWIEARKGNDESTEVTDLMKEE